MLQANPENGGHVLGRIGESVDTASILEALLALRRGDFTARLPVDWTGVEGKIADTFNDVTEKLERMTKELHRVSVSVGHEGKISDRLRLKDLQGSWDENVDSVNSLVSDLVHPTRETARVIGAVARGDLNQRMAFEVDGRALRGEFLRTAKTVNLMVTQLSSVASEVTRVVREVGNEGKLGGQVKIAGAAGTWKDLTDNINLMGANLTAQVRNLSAVTTAGRRRSSSDRFVTSAGSRRISWTSPVSTRTRSTSSFRSSTVRSSFAGRSTSCARFSTLSSTA